MTSARITQNSVRVVSNAVPKARITQQSIRVVSSAINHARITQLSVRVVSSNTADAPASAARPVVFVAT